MKRTLVAFCLASSILGVPCCQSVFAVDNLFSNSLFPDEKSKPQFSDFNMEAPSTISNSAKKDPEAAKKQYQEMVKHGDESMRSQMQKVASWLQEFSLRNQNRFPGVYGSSGTIGRAAEVQLTELVGANPYGGIPSPQVSQRELNGLSPGLAYYYNGDGAPVTSSPMANDEWTAELTADSAHRISLSMDQNASDQELDSFRNDPPDTMQGVPGEICAFGNSQGFIYVYGIGADGKVMKDYNGKPYIISAQTANNVNDQGQEAGY